MDFIFYKMAQQQQQQHFKIRLGCNSVFHCQELSSSSTICFASILIGITFLQRLDWNIIKWRHISKYVLDAIPHFTDQERSSSSTLTSVNMKRAANKITKFIPKLCDFRILFIHRFSTMMKSQLRRQTLIEFHISSSLLLPPIKAIDPRHFDRWT